VVGKGSVFTLTLPDVTEQRSAGTRSGGTSAPRAAGVPPGVTRGDA
jgi:hypothetical protein